MRLVMPATFVFILASIGAKITLPFVKTDLDRDGFTSSADCNDRNPRIYPGASERCDQLDGDCDGSVDEGVTTDLFVDLDGDGFGEDGVTTMDCPGSPGTASVAGDCDDGDKVTFPGAAEVCHDGVVNDCSGSVDSAQRECSRLTGEILTSTADRFGAISSAYSEGFTSLAAAGDIDGDGLEDYIAGLPNYCNCSNDYESPEQGYDGAAYFLLGAELLADVADTSFTVGLNHSRMRGESRAGDAVGSGVGGLGDLNADGFGEYFVTAPGTDYGADTGAGAVFIFHGAASPVTSGFPSDGANLMLWGNTKSDYLGANVARADDLDADGFDELFVSMAGDDEAGTGAGAVVVFDGKKLGRWTGNVRASKAEQKILGAASDDYFGGGLTSLEDIDGDGLDDLMVGAPRADRGGSSSGEVAIFLAGGSLATSGTISAADAEYTVFGAAADDMVGGVMSSAGDVDGDGLGDVLLGAWRVDTFGTFSGAAYLLKTTGAVLAGGSTLTSVADADLTFLGEAVQDIAGGAVGSLGDVDGDGRAEVMVGAIGYDTATLYNAGGVFLFYGDTLATMSGVVGLSSADAVFVGSAEQEAVGLAIFTGLELNGDGLPDMALSGYRDGEASGGLWMFFGDGVAY